MVSLYLWVYPRFTQRIILGPVQFSFFCFKKEILAENYFPRAVPEQHCG